MIYVQVKIKYRDGTREIFDCSDSPQIGNDWTTLFPIGDPTSRHHISTQKIEEIKYRYANKRK